MRALVAALVVSLALIALSDLFLVTAPLFTHHDVTYPQIPSFRRYLAKNLLLLAVAAAYGAIALVIGLRDEDRSSAFKPCIFVIIVSLETICIRIPFTIYFVTGQVIMLPSSRISLAMIWLPRLLEIILFIALFKSFMMDLFELSMNRMSWYDFNRGLILPSSILANLMWLSWWHYERRYNDEGMYEQTLAGGYSLDLENSIEDQVNPGFDDVLLLWLTPTLAKGYRAQLQLDDLPSLPQDIANEPTRWQFLRALFMHRNSQPAVQQTYKAVPGADHILTYRMTWMSKASSNNLNGAMVEFISILLNVHGKKFISVGVIKFCSCLSSFLGPVLLGAMVSYIEDYEGSTSERSLSYGLLLVSLLGCSFVLAAMLNTAYNIRCAIMQLQINGTLMRLVFHRAMMMPSYAWTEDLQLSQDQATTLIQVDVNRVANICQSVHDLWTLPLEIVTAFILLYFQVREAFFAGVVIIVIMIPINTMIARRIGGATKMMMAAKDKRIQILSEALHQIKGIKMMAWDDVVLSHAAIFRSLELKHLSTRKYLDAICVFLWASMPVLVPFATFLTTSLLGIPLTASKVFTTIALLNMLIFPMNAFPWVVNGFVEAKVSLTRIVNVCAASQFVSACDSRDDNHSNTNKTNSKSHLDFGYDISDYKFSRRFATKPIDAVISKSDSMATATVRAERTPLKVDATWRLSGGRKKLQEKEDDSIISPMISYEAEDFQIGPILRSFNQGSAIAIIGSIASGKSSLLLSFLEEVRLVQGNQPFGKSKIGYCSQTPSFHSHISIRENITLGKDFDDARYRHILHGCSLDEDFQVSSFRWVHPKLNVDCCLEQHICSRRHDDIAARK
jgi:ABC-type multidrug transport system fused ATPase/permease subunit